MPPGVPLFRRIPLKIALVAPFIVLTLLAAGLVGYLSFLNGKQAVNDVAYELRREITRGIQGHLSSFLGTPRQINRLNASLINQGLLDGTQPATLERHFWEQVGLFGSVTSIYMGNTGGGLVNSGREVEAGERYIIATEGFRKGAFTKYATDGRGHRGDALLTVSDFDARTRHWYRHAVETGGDAWSPVYILFTGQDMAVAASRPVYDTQGALIGVVSVDISLSQISHFLNGLAIGKTGKAFIIERSGLLIASSSLEKPFTLPGRGGPQRRIQATESTSPVIAHAAEALGRQEGAYDAVTEERNVEFLLDGKRHFLQVSPLGKEHGLDWLIAVVVPEADFTEQIQANNRVTILLVAGTLLVIMAIGILTATRISRPIQRLTNSALALAEGEWKHEIPDESQFDEISTLVRSFNRMAGQLKEMLNTLNHENAERRHAEASLRSSEAHLRTLIETIPDLIWLKNPEGGYLGCNAKFERLFGATEAEIIGKTDYDFVDGKLADFFRENDRAAMAAGKPTINEEEVTYADDGHRELLETIKTPMYDSRSNLIGVLGIARDITHRKEAEESLRREKEFTETALQAQKDTFFLFDPTTGKALRWNRAFKELSGYSDEEIAELPAPHTYLRPKDLAKAMAFIDQERRTGTGSIELDLLCRDGRTVPIEYSVSFIGNGQGEPAYIILIGRDIRERKRIEAQLQQTQKMDAIATLAGGIAHDFNNMLGVITGNVSYSLTLLDREDELYHVLTEMKNGAKQAQGLTRQLLTFARGGAPIKKTSDLNRLVREAAQFVMRGAKSTSRFELSPDLWPAEVDEGQINQVVNNLVINANQAMPQGGVITIRTKNREIPSDNILSLKGGRYVEITIEDQGTGISEKIQKNIFEPFFTTKQKGSGLGLATAYSIMKRHGGRITVYSEVDKGAVFHLYLPASQNRPESEAEMSTHLHRGHGRVLVLDDQELILDMVGRMLGRMGYEAEGVADGHQAVETYRSAYENGHPFDLVILDLTIPGGIGGAEAMPDLLKIDPGLKAVASSGYSNDPVMSNYRDYGFCGVIPKPYSVDQLSELLNKLFGETGG